MGHVTSPAGHVIEEAHDAEDGVEFLTSTRKDWGDTSFAGHITWHLTLYHLGRFQKGEEQWHSLATPQMGASVCMKHLAFACGSGATDRARPEPCGGSNSEEITNNCKAIHAGILILQQLFADIAYCILACQPDWQARTLA